jgi:hypothetical protein
MSDVSALYLGSLPLHSTATRAALPAMSLAPVVPFAPATARPVMFDQRERDFAICRAASSTFAVMEEKAAPLLSGNCCWRGNQMSAIARIVVA